MQPGKKKRYVGISEHSKYLVYTLAKSLNNAIMTFHSCISCNAELEIQKLGFSGFGLLLFWVLSSVFWVGLFFKLFRMFFFPTFLTLAVYFSWRKG